MRSGGAARHIAVILAGLMLASARAAAQEPASEPDADTEPDAGTLPVSPPAEPEDDPVAGSAPDSAAALDAPVEQATDDELPPMAAYRAQAAPREPAAPPTAPTPQRPRGWRYPHEVVRRPLTLPSGVWRIDQLIAGTVQPTATGGTLAFSWIVSTAVGIIDELEVGTTPLAWTYFPPRVPDDPYFYARVRPLSGDVQLAFRAGVWIPVTSNPGSAQMQVTAELAWLATPFFRLDVALDYQLLFTDPLHQRVGVPITGTFQSGIHAVALTSGVFVFNDADDVDVPLLLTYTVAFRGHRMPAGEWAFDGGFLDLQRAEDAWTMRSRVTFFM
jgi:hypothetical protein